jgi:hypothetical protein
VTEDSAEQLGIRHVHFIGADDMQASIPVRKALSRDGDVLLAYEMNGADIPSQHGYVWVAFWLCCTLYYIVALCCNLCVCVCVCVCVCARVRACVTGAEHDKYYFTFFALAIGFLLISNSVLLFVYTGLRFARLCRATWECAT